MPHIVVGNGTTLTTKQEPGLNFNVIVAQFGSIAVAGDTALELAGNNGVTVSGEILSGTAAAILVAGTSSIHVTSTGRIASSGPTAIYVASSAASVSLNNAGYIGSNGPVALDLFLASDSVINSGVIAGSILLRDGNDSFINRGGEVHGSIDAGDGNDRLVIDSVALGASTLQFNGDAGTDTVDTGAFGGAVWIHLGFNGPQVWTRDNFDLESDNPWRVLAYIDDMENVGGSMGSDFLAGNDEDNTFFMSGGLDEIHGRLGTDTFDAQSFSSGIWVDLTYADHQVWTQNLPGVMVAGGTWEARADLILVENVVSTARNDQIFGDGTNNTFYFLNTAGPNQIDIFDGRGGTDTIDFSREQVGAVYVHLGFAGLEVWTQYLTTPNVLASWFVLADLAGIENVVGTDHQDDLIGNEFANRLEGGRSADQLQGRGGADTFVYDISTAALAGETSGDRDIIDDFLPGVDRIGLSGVTTMPPIVIGAAPTPTTTARTLLYNTSTGILALDTNGSIAGGVLELAILDGNPSLTASDFVLL